MSSDDDPDVLKLQKRKTELGFAVLFVVLATCLLIAVPFQVAEMKSTLHMSSRYRTLQASDFPYAIGAFLLILSLVYLVGCLRARTQELRESIVIANLPKLLVIFALFVAYVVLFRLTGFIVSSALFLGVATVYLGNRNLLAIVLLAIVTPVAIYYCLNDFLLISVP